MRAVLREMDAHGYDRVSPPLVEFEESLAHRMDTRMNGADTRHMMRFTDPVSLRTLAIRSDITPQIGRIATTALARAPRPLRLCYAGDVALIVAPQLEPSRQRLQAGAELIGTDTVAAAAETVSLAVASLTAAGANGLTVDFTLPDLVDVLAADALPLSAEKVATVRTELDAKDAGGLAAGGGEAYLPLIYAAGEFGVAIERLEAIDAGGALQTRIDALRAIAASLPEGVRITLDPSERHGFEYQSWFGFTLFADDLRGAAGRGGTYEIEGSGEKATGFSLYLDTLIDAVPDARASAICFLPVGHDRARGAALRKEGWRTRAALGECCDPAALGCSHILADGEPVPLS